MRCGTQFYNSSHSDGVTSLGGTRATGRLSTLHTSAAFCRKQWLHGWNHLNIKQKTDPPNPSAGRGGRGPLLAPAAVLLLGCVETPPPRPVRGPPPPPPPNTQVYAYPQQGQTPEQTDRDRYDCHEWAVKQTQFDP